MTDDHRIAKGNSGQGVIRDDVTDGDKTRFRPGDTIIADAPQAPDLTVTHYSASHNHSAGFAQARELVKQSQSGKGTLLKKRFLLEEVLGHGGMGTVYKAKDLRKVEAEDPDPYIATKVLNQDFKDHPDAFVTLQQETAKSQTLAHPNIVTVHDFDRDGDILFMTMELLEGKPLDQLIKAYRHTGLPKEQVWKITRDLCAALAYAHQRQLIHADFKPGNIFVNNDGHAKVLDFGIARAANREAQKHRFDAGQLGALTPAYATVEMVKDEPLGFSDDVYALACVVYEMLAGRHPYNQRSAFEAQQQKLIPKRLDNLSAREWKALNHALALDKSARTPSIAQFADELFPKRNPVVLTAALGLAVVSLVGAGWFGYSQHQAQQQVQKTVQQKITAAQLCFAHSDFSCAIEQALVAVNLDSANNVAAQLLQAAQVAQTAREQESRLQELLVQAQECVAKQDLDCAVLFADKLREADADYPALQLLDQQIHSARTQGEQAAAAQQQMINQQLAVAQNCLIKNDYACVQEQASAILALEPANTQAIEIRQQANLAQQQQKEIAVKVDKLLADANTCMTKKNYSCAIAKAESAMELDAGNKQAEALRVRAMDTQRKLKETGFTIK
ncbi:serine/threonine-protein kinase [Cellvibrio sp. UBA7661]|uniref:serine/threonine-protein kinase n=1 Tax=Cellvibrio sp. UBA7661 TaxID=1946311 RepID=UPI002F357C28